MMTSGAKAANDGLAIEKLVARKLACQDPDAVGWLAGMGLGSPLNVMAEKIDPKEKRDLKIIATYEDHTKASAGVSIKSCAKLTGSGQLTRFKPYELGRLFGMPGDLVQMVREFTGDAFWECAERRPDRRLLFTFSEAQRNRLAEFLYYIKDPLIRWMFVRNETDLCYMLTVLNASRPQKTYVLRRMEDVIAYFSEGVVRINDKGFQVGRINFQRKGGDSFYKKDDVRKQHKCWHRSACDIQSKIDSSKLLRIQEAAC
jgi:hypothetical protein